MNAITTKELRLAYDGHRVVNCLDLMIPRGKVTSLIGPNGCGKSTILKAVGRILKPQKGWVFLNGSDIQALPTREVAKRMSILPQTPTAPAGLTVRELVSYGRFPRRQGLGKLKKEDEDMITWAMEVTRLSGLETAAVDALSGGQRQRVWIAMALAQETDLILLDEPTTYLDMAYQLEVLELLEKLNRERNCTIAMVLHDLNLASRFSDFLVAIRGGSIVAQGTPEEIMTPGVLRDTFHIDAEIAADPRTGRPACISYHLI
ncbi:MAG TPA: Fe(3+)-dicitrate ABC transporter ATP-binding protein [Lachnoclostridium sp.]|jgi:iron complex transport system ATP-binding protein|uniref:ABC transporter ATP-binding protein n=1 Tax=Lacrimispora sp. TaxID=2719234 RepID=UPI000EB8D712|nr:ABC transporter ATP-binding protein [Lacrimispora sp.]HCD45868.1 Fe(3+)-dicitrate ABC transporter ATP-binding protein [Lachnoclostridium sp.]